MMQLLSIFAVVFVAELGDKTQLATLLFASDAKLPRWHVFLAAAGALCLSTAIAVLIGSLAGQYLARLPLKLFAGIGFIMIGLWTLYGHFTA